MELVGYEDVEARSHEALASLVVHLVSDDIRLNLKSELSKYFSLAKIFSDGNKVSELEVVAYNVDDIKLLMDYMIDRKVA